MTLKQALWEIVRDENIIITNQNIDWLLDRAEKRANDNTDKNNLKDSILGRKATLDKIGRQSIKTIGEILYEKRKAKGWTQKALAQKIGVSQISISAWEYGKSYPNAIYLVSLAEEFDCTIDELCGRRLI